LAKGERCPVLSGSMRIRIDRMIENVSIGMGQDKDGAMSCLAASISATQTPALSMPLGAWSRPSAVHQTATQLQRQRQRGVRAWGGELDVGMPTSREQRRFLLPAVGLIGVNAHRLIFLGAHAFRHGEGRKGAVSARHQYFVVYAGVRDGYNAPPDRLRDAWRHIARGVACPGA
jgi:hypothetical protein